MYVITSQLVCFTFKEDFLPSSMCLQTIFRDVYGQTEIELERLNEKISKDDLSIDDLNTYFSDLNNATEQDINQALSIFEAAENKEISVQEDIYKSFNLRR